MPDRDPDLEPAFPAEEGVTEQSPPPMQVEPARLLANDARGRLRDEGFDDEQIEKWADAYIAEHRHGDVDTFVAWIHEQERD